MKIKKRRINCWSSSEYSDEQNVCYITWKANNPKSRRVLTTADTLEELIEKYENKNVELYETDFWFRNSKNHSRRIK